MKTLEGGTRYKIGVRNTNGFGENKVNGHPFISKDGLVRVQNHEQCSDQAEVTDEESDFTSHGEVVVKVSAFNYPPIAEQEKKNLSINPDSGLVTTSTKGTDYRTANPGSGFSRGEKIEVKEMPRNQRIEVRESDFFNRKFRPYEKPTQK